ncbi:conjugal transfer protein TraX [Tissierella sp. P1]|uniref:TraX family protein n=1 Tax=Tissierella TaxID=41273 RepID=UPI000B9FFA46|nr:TraX family protein [Tissierella sp. P1]OZV13916.1 conjugal transfer protein TraX [Tissierella sp. P1]
MFKKGLTGFQIKLIALFLMIFDHVHYFFAFTNQVPLWFTWIGRVVAPIFIFMVVEGFIHTRNRSKYMGRLYMGSLIMFFSNQWITKWFQRGDNVALMANIFATLFLITVYLTIIDYLGKGIKERRIMPIVLGILGLVLPVGLGIFMMMNLHIPGMIYAMFLLPTPMIVEGGPVFVGLGILFYLSRDKKALQLTLYALVSIALIPWQNLSLQGLFYNNFQWLMIGALPFLALYNGQRGKGMKYLFYVFYPLHIYGLYILSTFFV